MGKRGQSQGGADQRGGEEARRGLGDLSQSRAAIWTAVSVMLLVEGLGVVLWLAELATGRPGLILGSAAISLFLGINLLRGKRWARTWILVRVVLGLIVFGIMWAALGEYSSFALQVGFCVAIIVLLTGTGTTARIVSGIAVFVVGAVVSVAIVVAPPSVATQEVLPYGEPEIPSHYTTHTSRGLFRISYPAEWSVFPDALLDEVVAAVKESWASDDDLDENQLAQVQYLFGVGAVSSDGYCIATMEPRPAGPWTLDAVVQGGSQFLIEIVQGYREHSQLKTIVGGIDAIIVGWEGDLGWGLQRSLSLYAMADDRVWTVECISDKDDFEQFEDDFDSIVRSLRIFR